MNEKENQAADEHNNQTESKSESSSTPGIKPGYDYIWGSDQDDLVKNPGKKD